MQKEVDRPSVAIETEELSAGTFILQILHIVGYTIPQSASPTAPFAQGSLMKTAIKIYITLYYFILFCIILRIFIFR